MAIEKEIKFNFVDEVQAKFLPNIMKNPPSTPNVIEDDLKLFLLRIKSLFEFGGYETSEIVKVSNEDWYLDTKDLELAKSHYTFRVRTNEKEKKWTIKKPKSRDLGIQTREELEGVLPDNKDFEQEKIKLVKEHLSDFINKEMITSAKIYTDRYQFTASLLGEATNYKICLDNVTFKHPESNITNLAQAKFDIELEIEANTEYAMKGLKALKNSLKNIFPEFEFSHESKYRRAIAFIEKLKIKQNFKR